jgi:hypothetical protein
LGVFQGTKTGGVTELSTRAGDSVAAVRRPEVFVLWRAAELVVAKSAILLHMLQTIVKTVFRSNSARSLAVYQVDYDLVGAANSHIQRSASPTF